MQLLLFDVEDNTRPRHILPMMAPRPEPPRRQLEPGETVMHAATYRTDAKPYTVVGYDRRGGLVLLNPRTKKQTSIPARGVLALERDAAAVFVDPPGPLPAGACISCGECLPIVERTGMCAACSEIAYQCYPETRS
jgi:hypothetical protein